MDIKDDMVMNEITFQLLYSEHIIYQPECFGMTPIWSNDTNFLFNSIYELKEFQLYLKSFTISSERGYLPINGVKPEPIYINSNIDTMQYINIMEPIKYTGSIIIGNQFLKSYNENDEIACYCYKLVKELIFHEGKLVTAIDQSKAMLRIRKNLDLGLRRLDKKQDVKCIQQFINASFVGCYELTVKVQKKKQTLNELPRERYLDKIKNSYTIFRKE